MKNTFDFKSFRNLKKGNSLITEDVVDMGVDYRIRGFDVPKTLVNAFKKKAKDSGYDISGKFADTELAEFIAKYIQTKFLTIDNLPLDVLGDEYAGVQIQTKPVQTVQQEQTSQKPEGQNIQAQVTAQEIPAKEGGQGQGAIQGQSQTQGQGQTQGQSQVSTQEI
ncbi:MAG: hypothetical protein HPY57_16060 [Ignavibacteria bacterium]|nr:hypothetical protein [Ignavibacteria bacterium]